MDIDGVIYCSKCLQRMEAEEVCPHCGYDPSADMPSRAVLDRGTLLNGRYQLGAVIGRGGFGITYAAWDETLGMPVAVKEYFPGEFVSRDTEESDDVVPIEKYKKEYAIGLSRFVRESQVLAMLHEIPGVVKVLDCFGENETYYIAMEYIRGVPLDEYVKKKRPGAQEVIELMRQSVEALMAAHRQGVLHRDICPNNIMVQEDRSIKLIDFGAAAQVRRQQEGKDRSIMLTEKYAAIEQYDSGMSQGPWTDIYCLSATMYTVLTGENPPESVRRVTADEIVPIEKQGLRLKKHQCRAIMGGLAVQPEKRIRSMEEFRALLYDLPMPEEIQRRRRFMRRFWISVAVFALAVIIVTVNFVMGLPLGRGLLYSLRLDGFHVIGSISMRPETSVPENIIGIPVTRIYPGVFSGNTAIERVKLPGTVTEIEEMSFLNCPRLEQVVMSEGTGSISSYAFADCPALNSVYVPDSANVITETAFENAPGNMTIWSSHEAYAHRYALGNGIGWACTDDFEYETDGEEVTVTAYRGQGTSIYVPSYIDGMPVTAFSAEHAVNMFPADVTEVVLPEHLRVLPTGLLTGKGSLKKVYLGSALVEIAPMALAETGITELELPVTLKVIGDEAFLLMPIKQLELPDGLESIGKYAFSQTHLVSIELPDSVSEVGRSTFYACTNLEYVRLSPGMYSVPYECFYACKSLADVVIPEGICVVEVRAFEGCEEMMSLQLPDSLHTIEPMAFKYCTNLRVLFIPDIVAQNSDQGIAVNAFVGCPNDMIFVGAPGTIAERAAAYFEYDFEDSFSLINNPSVVMGMNGGIWIKEDMEYVDTLKLPSAYFSSEGMPVIAAQVLEAKDVNARCVVLPRFTDEVSAGAFACVEGLEEVHGENCSEIKTLAFFNCPDLTAVDIPEGTVRIDDSAFAKCGVLTDVELPGTLTYIGECAFFDCGGISEISIPGAVAWLPGGCFGRTSIREITIPGNVSVVSAAFYECGELEVAVAEEGVRTLEGTFCKCGSLREVVLPSTLEWVSQSVFMGCTGLKDVWIFSMDANFEYYDMVTVKEVTVYDPDTNTFETNVILLEGLKDESRHVFSDCPDVVIHGYAGSTAEQYAKQHGLAFEPIEQ